MRQLDDYVLPRLRDVDAPVLAVVGGSTGAGKSTLVNSLVGAEVSRTGRAAPDDPEPGAGAPPRRRAGGSPTIGSSRPRPGPRRVVGAPATTSSWSLATPCPTTLALLDAPDIDSVVDANRAMAAQLLDAADLWLFVTTAARYADAVPWEFLRRAVARGVGIGLVLNRVPPGAAAEIGPAPGGDAARPKGSGWLRRSPIEEQPLVDGRLPAACGAADQGVDRLRSPPISTPEPSWSAAPWSGTIGELAVRSERVAVAAEYQDEMLGWLGDRARDAFDRAVWNVAVDVRDGTVMRGEVLARWQDVVGTGELLRSLQSSIGRFRDRVTSAVTGRPGTASASRVRSPPGSRPWCWSGSRRRSTRPSVNGARSRPARRSSASGPRPGTISRGRRPSCRAVIDRHGARLAGRVDGSAAP